MRYQVQHETVYQYESAVTQSYQLLNMTPRDTLYQQTLSHQLSCKPTPYEQSNRIDFFGNPSDFLTILKPHKTLTVYSAFAVQLQALPDLPALMQTDQSWEYAKSALIDQSAAHLDAMNYCYSSPKINLSTELATFALSCFTTGRPLIDATMALTQKIFHEFEFDPRATDVSTPLDKVLSGRRGVCQDFAHLMIGAMRSIGLSCRYVSGYILTHPPAGQPRMIGADASHAWVSIYSPNHGWVDFDPTNNCLVQHEHITVAWGRDFSDVSPMRGVVLGGGKQKLKVSVTVMPQENCAVNHF